MRYSYNWLKRNIWNKKDVQEVLGDLTMKSFEVENLEKLEEI